jgi:methylenetetrahydrofolate reductase (NADPH)
VENYSLRESAAPGIYLPHVNKNIYRAGLSCRLAGITVQIIAGIMPITSLRSMRRISEPALGARIPSGLLQAVTGATEQVRDLPAHRVAGVHFYTLNRSDATLKIYRSLGIHSSEEVGGLKDN